MPSCRVTIRIPGRRGGGGAAAFASDAAATVSNRALSRMWAGYAPIPLGSFESARVEPLLTEPVWSLTMVDVDDERLKVLASGARCVSLSFLVSFQDMAAAGTIQKGRQARDVWNNVPIGRVNG